MLSPTKDKIQVRKNINEFIMCSWLWFHSQVLLFKNGIQVWKSVITYSWSELLYLITISFFLIWETTSLQKRIVAWKYHIWLKICNFLVSSLCTESCDNWTFLLKIASVYALDVKRSKTSLIYICFDLFWFDSNPRRNLHWTFKWAGRTNFWLR